MVMIRDWRMVSRFIRYLETLYWTPYRYGGNDPMEGFDCSNLIVEGLKSIGALTEAEFLNSDDLWAWLNETCYVDNPRKGALVFFGESNPATFDVVHVAVCLDSHFMIEAGGGGRRTTNTVMASRHNAYIRRRPICRRDDLIGFCDPFTKGGRKLWAYSAL